MKRTATSIRDHLVSRGLPGRAPLPSPLDCETAFQIIAANCLQLIQRHRRPAMTADADALHAMRIELTRLRAAVCFFGPMAKDAAWPSINKDLRWLNSALGEARDHDVTASYARRKRYRRWAKKSRYRILRRQHKAHRSLGNELGSARYRRLMTALHHWIANGLWLQTAQSLRSEHIKSYSRARLGKWRRIIARKGRRLRTLRRKTLHRIRIQCKRYRYIVAALQTLDVAIERRDRTFVEAAKRVHRALGDLRDIERLQETARRRPPGYRKTTRKLLRQAQSALQHHS